MRKFIEDLLGMDFDKLLTYLIFIFISFIAGTVIGVYIDSWLKYIELF